MNFTTETQRTQRTTADKVSDFFVPQRNKLGLEICCTRIVIDGNRSHIHLRKSASI